MSSSFGWLDTDANQRRRMLEVVDMFKDEDTVDELGVGAIRDALSGALFPGMSTIHTRLRYILFIPWLLERASHKPTQAEMTAEFRSLEYRLIGSLLAGGEQLGVIGSRARDNLRRLPSGVYWSALGTWGIRQENVSIDGYFRRQQDLRLLVRRTAVADDPETRDALPGSGIDPHLPRAPEDLLQRATFDLTSEEEAYLSDVIVRSTGGSMLAWLVLNRPGNRADNIWQLDNLTDAPAHLAETIDHGRRFHTVIHGAVLLYNMLLARKRSSEELVVHYEGKLREWNEEKARTRALEGWDRAGWWATVAAHNPRIRTLTRTFVDSWIDLVSAGVDVVTDNRAATLVSVRERQIKGGRARLVNQAALDRWTGASGVGRLDFNWSVARRHLEDIYAARSRS